MMSKSAMYFSRSGQAPAQHAGQMSPKAVMVFAGLLAALLIALIIRNSALYPGIFADEYTYSRNARLLPLSDASIPGFVYLWIYRFTNVCGDAYLQCTRVTNSVAFLLSAPFLYATARRYSSHGIALLITILVLAGPLNVYTVFFVPEPLYFLAFWVLTWHLLRAPEVIPARHWVIAGAILAIAALVKPHALLLAPAVLVFVVYATSSSGWLASLRACCLLLLAFFAVKLGVGYLSAGSRGLTLMGSAYSAQAEQAGIHYESLVLNGISSLRGHLQSIVLLFSVPVAILCTRFFRMTRAGGRDMPADRLVVYTAAVLFNLVCVTVIFTASMVGVGVFETAARMHSRYYNFALPLLMLIACLGLSGGQAQVGKSNSESARPSISKLRLGVALLLAAVICYAVFTRFSSYTPSFFDTPELQGVKQNSAGFLASGILAAAAVLLWAVRPRHGSLLYLGVACPVMTVVSLLIINHDLQGMRKPTIHDIAGQFVHQVLPVEDRNRVLVLNTDHVSFFRALMHVDAPHASWVDVPDGQAYDISTAPRDRKWLLTFGTKLKGAENLYQIKAPGFTLTRLSGESSIVFKEGNWPDVLESTSGLSSVENWGMWSNGKVVTLNFVAPLPENPTLTLWANAYGPNVNKPIVVRLGGESATIELAASPGAREIKFRNPDHASTITLEVPAPTAPAELGDRSGDTRKLGIGFVRLDVR